MQLFFNVQFDIGQWIYSLLSVFQMENRIFHGTNECGGLDYALFVNDITNWDKTFC